MTKKKSKKKKATSKKQPTNLISHCTFDFGGSAAASAIEALAGAAESNADALAANARAIMAIADNMRDADFNQTAIDIG